MLELTDSERVGLVNLVQALVNVVDYAGFERLLRNELREIFPYKMMGGGAGYTNNEQSFHLYCAITIDLPVSYIQEMMQEDGSISSPLLIQWFKDRRPRLLEVNAQTLQHIPPALAEKFRRYGIYNVAAHGSRDLLGNAITYFSFNNMPEPFTNRQSDLLEILVPMLHSALLRVMPDVPPLQLNTTRRLSRKLLKRELELVTYLYKGMSNKEIADAMGLTPNTVRNKLHVLFVKLGVENRTQAVRAYLAAETPYSQAAELEMQNH